MSVVLDGDMFRASGRIQSPVEAHRHTGDSTQPTYLAHQFALSVYDAAYLSHALERNLELAKLDTALNCAARKAGVKLSR